MRDTQPASNQHLRRHVQRRRRRIAAWLGAILAALLLGIAGVRWATSGGGVARAADVSPPPLALPTLAPSPPPVSFHLTAGQWQLTPDGTWTAVVKATYLDAAGNDVHQVHGDVDFNSSADDTLGLVRRIYLDPVALITLRESRPVNVTARSNQPALGSASVSLQAPVNQPLAFAAVAQAVGPRLVNVGWTPLAPLANVLEYKVYRAAGAGTAGHLVAVVSPSGHALRDRAVEPDRRYHYTVLAAMRSFVAKAQTSAVETPPAMSGTSVNSISGKGMFLYFAPMPDGDHGWGKLDPEAIVTQARNAGISNIELRMAYGSFFEADSAASLDWMNRLIDAAASAGIRMLAWEVPRRGTTEDAAESVAIARHRTPRGNGFVGLALDIENGDDYMGDGELAKQSMVDYIEMVRDAVGAGYLVVATVISPHLTHWTNKEYPYARIAPYASVMQPMEYWHHFYTTSHHNYTQAEIAGACAGAVADTRRLSGRDIPVNVAGQSVDIGQTGVPSGEEITWSLEASKAAGAVGEMFFDWTGTTTQGWSSISAFPW